MTCRAVHQVNTSFVLRKEKVTTALPLTWHEVGEDTSFYARELQVATREGFDFVRRECVRRVDTAAREAVGTTREGLLEWCSQAGCE